MKTCTNYNDAERTACPVCLVSALTAERDQLRGALALGQQNCDAVYDELRADVVRLTARAERAEAAETVALAHWNGALERAMKAEADLATERARLDWLDNHFNYELMITVFGEKIGLASDGGPRELRAVDAAMKESTP